MAEMFFISILIFQTWFIDIGKHSWLTTPPICCCFLWHHQHHSLLSLGTRSKKRSHLSRTSRIVCKSNMSLVGEHGIIRLLNIAPNHTRSFSLRLTSSRVLSQTLFPSFTMFLFPRLSVVVCWSLCAAFFSLVLPQKWSVVVQNKTSAAICVNFVLLLVGMFEINILPEYAKH